MDAALELQQQVLPGMRSLMGKDYSPLAQLVGQELQQAGVAAAQAGGIGPSAADEGGESGAAVPAEQKPGKYVAASVKRYLQQQAAEAAQVKALVAELKQMEAGMDGDGQQHPE